MFLTAKMRAPVHVESAPPQRQRDHRRDRRPVEHLERAGFVVMKRPPEIGTALLGRGFEA